MTFYYPYPTPTLNRNFYQSTSYPPWMAQPTYTYKELSEMRYSQQWMAPAMSNGGLSELGLSELNYSQPQWIPTAPTISPTYYPAPMLSPYPLMMTQSTAMYPSMSPSVYPSPSPMSYYQPQTWSPPTQWSPPTSMFRYY